MADARERLKSLEGLLDDGLISGNEYAEKRKRILDELLADSHEPAAAEPITVADSEPMVRRSNWRGPLKAFLWVVIPGVLFLGCVSALDNAQFTTITPRTSNGTGTQSTSPPRTTSTIVSYEVTGTASSVAITMENDSGGTDQITVPLPWTWRSTNFSRGAFLYISAQNQDDSGSIRCNIEVQGAVVFTSIAEGAYAICTASGSLP